MRGDPFLFFIMSKLQVLSFMFVSNFRRCPLSLKLMSFVLNVSKSCTLCPLGQTQLIFPVKCSHVQGTWGKIIILLMYYQGYLIILKI
ncbi:hypothetical protein Hanom_Chr12g01139391 [Helianthus anomalus]